MSERKYLLLNLPNPPGRNIYREFAGGFGTHGSLSSETLLPSYLVYGASAAKNSGCPYEVVDGQAMKYDDTAVLKLVGDIGPDIILTWVSLPSLYHDLELLKNIKKSFPDILIVALGGICNVLPEEALRSGVDLVLKGYHPHYSLVSDLINVFADHPVSTETYDLIGGAMYLKDGVMSSGPLEPPVEDLDEISFGIYRSLPVSEYIGDFGDIHGNVIKCIPIVTSAGCPFGCMYCPYPLAYGKKVVHKSIDTILSEVEFLKTNFGIRGFIFRDQLFTYHKDRVEQLCDEIIKRDLDINWFVEARIDQVDEGMLAKMRSAGCFRIHYGVETGTPEMLIKTGKPGLKIEKVKQVFKMTKDAGIFSMAHIILGLPSENKDTLKNTLELLYDLNPDGVSLNICTPYPGTKLFGLASGNDWITTYDWSRYTSFNAIMGTETLSVDDLVEARKDIKNKFRNFKLLHDPNYRKLFLRSLPRKLYYRYFVK